MQPARGVTLARWLAALGGLCWRRAWTVVLLWIGAAILAGATAPSLSERLLSGSGDIADSASLRVDEILRTEFRGTDAQTLILTLRPAPGGSDGLLPLVDNVTEALTALPVVATVINERDLTNPRLTPEPGSGHFILIELRTPDALATEQEVPRLRAEIAPLMEAAKTRHGAVDWALTGRAALTYDINRFNVEDATRAELRALPITLIVLVLAFGSLVSAVLPLLLAILTRTVALGIIFLLAGSFEISNLVLSVVTMLAIALGIDYSLFLIHRYRRELVRLGPQAPDSAPPQEAAIRSAMAQSGEALVYSAITVAIGMLALLATPLMETRSIGVAGAFAVLVALLTSLTLVPAFLRLLGDNLLEWPRSLSRRMNGETSRRLWQGWAALLCGGRCFRSLRAWHCCSPSPRRPCTRASAFRTATSCRRRSNMPGAWRCSPEWNWKGWRLPCWSWSATRPAKRQSRPNAFPNSPHSPRGWSRIPGSASCSGRWRRGRRYLPLTLRRRWPPRSAARSTAMPSPATTGPACCSG